MEICTIGFTQTTAEHFFRRLADAGVERLLDVRLNNSSQLAGFRGGAVRGRVRSAHARAQAVELLDALPLEAAP